MTDIKRKIELAISNLESDTLSDEVKIMLAINTLKNTIEIIEKERAL